MTVDKAKTEAELHKAWDGIRRLVESLSERELTEPGVVDQWSVKDLLGHMAFWAEKSARDLALVTEGRAGEIETPQRRNLERMEQARIGKTEQPVRNGATRRVAAQLRGGGGGLSCRPCREARYRREGLDCGPSFRRRHLPAL